MLDGIKLLRKREVLEEQGQRYCHFRVNNCANHCVSWGQDHSTYDHGLTVFF